MPSIPATPLRSTSSEGAASRIESSGTRLWPPASTLAPGSPARAATASVSDPGRRYANGAGFTVPSMRVQSLGALRAVPRRLVVVRGRVVLHVCPRLADGDDGALVVARGRDPPRQVVATDDHDRAQRDPTELEVVGDLEEPARPEPNGQGQAGRDRHQVHRVGEVDAVLDPDLRAEQADHP